jgi:hypothetical protein
MHETLPRTSLRLWFLLVLAFDFSYQAIAKKM